MKKQKQSNKSNKKTLKINTNKRKKIEKRIEIKHKNIIKIVNLSHSADELFCGDYNKLTIYYEYFPNNLSAEISRRKLSEVFL